MYTTNLILSDEQKKIIELNSGKHLVLAAPGTGKTELLALRVLGALDAGVEENKTICLTFTNKAAKGMKERILEKQPLFKGFVGNLHAFCAQFLFKNKLISQFSALMDEDDIEQLMNEAKSEISVTSGYKNIELRNLNKYITQVKFNLSNDILLQSDAKLKHDNVAEAICEKYQELKEQFNILDFDDLLNLTYTALLSDNKPLLNVNYEWIQVDEVQDLNALQWAIIELISAKNAHAVYYGDYLQAIFSFMGARIDKLQSLEQSCIVHNLTNNYRSPSYLLDVYNNYAMEHLSPNWSINPKAVNNANHSFDYLKFYHIKGDQYKEAEFIVNKILNELDAKTEGQTAILVRKNDSADYIGDLLEQNNYNFIKISGYELFERKIIKDVMAFLSVLNNPNDRLAWVRILYIFTSISTLKEARKFINQIYKLGFLPLDFISETKSINNLISDFLLIVNNRRLVIFDTETTGLDTLNDDIIQIAATEIINNKIGKTFEVYIKTDKDLSSTEKIHHISKKFLDENGVEPEKALELFSEFVNNDYLLAHNSNFDTKILTNYSNRYSPFANFKFNNKCYDSLELTKRMYPKLYSYKLSDLIKTFEIEGVNSHNALDDVKATANLVIFLCKMLPFKAQAQMEFIEGNKLILTKLNNNFINLWNYYQENKNNEITFQEIIDKYFNFLTSELKVKYEEENIEYLQFLKRHMEYFCKPQPLKLLIKKYIPDYKRFKMADLVVGNEKVVLSTVHKAKGLEFENVIIPECIADVYPWYKSTGNSRIEDARNLYVALTRAKKRIIITAPKSLRTNYGTYNKSISPFFNCIKHYFELIESNGN